MNTHTQIVTASNLTKVKQLRSDKGYKPRSIVKP